jgi:primosomal protein N' (replication factor Y)
MRTHARKLRLNATDAERQLWSVLRNRQLSSYRFRRQHPIGPFIADFACTRYRVVIEADGAGHKCSRLDKRRTAELERRGWRVIRFWNGEILMDPDGVATQILRALENS